MNINTRLSQLDHPNDVSVQPHSIPHRSPLESTRWSIPEVALPSPPVLKAFGQLEQDPHFINPSFEVSSVLDSPASVSWTVARIKAIFDAIYRSSVSTEDDLEKVRKLSEEVSVHERNLDADLTISDDDRGFEDKCLKTAKEALGELQKLLSALNEFNPIEDEFVDAVGNLNDRTLSPIFSGEELFAASYIPKGLEVLLKLHAQMAKLPEGSAAKTRLQGTLEHDTKEFIFMVGEWKDIAIKTMQEERALLLKELDKSSENKNEYLRQLDALQQQQLLICNELDAAITLLKDHPELGALSEALRASRDIVQKEHDAIAREVILPMDVIPLKYGEDEWLGLMAKRPKKPFPAVSLLAKVFDAENWSNSTKAIVRGLFSTMQLSQNAIEFSQRFQQIDVLKKQAEAMTQKVTPEREKEIHRDVGRLGTLLSDKYPVLQKNPELIDHFSRGNAQLREALAMATEQLGTVKPTREQIVQFQDAFRMKSMAASVKSPFSHLSMQEWWSLFTNPVDVEEPKSETVSCSGSVMLLTDKEVASVTVLPPQPLAWPQRLISTIGNFLFPESTQEQSFAAFIETKAAQGQDELQRAMRVLSDDLSAIRQVLPHNLVDVSQEIILLQRELIATSQKPIGKTTSLIQLADWTQEVSDKCNAVKQMRNYLKGLMPQFSLTNLVEDVHARDELKRVIEGESMPVDKKLILHLLGDYFGIGTRLEGNRHEAILSYAISVMDHMQGEISAEVQEIKVKLIAALDLFKSFLGKFRPSHQKITQAFKDLPVGESILIPGGWTGRQEGHAIYYEVVRDGENSFRFRIYNTGGGVGYHPSAVVGLERKYSRTLEVMNVPLAKLTDHLFTRTLWELQQPPRGDAKEWGEKDVYNGLLWHLGGEVSSQPFYWSDLFSSQTSGTCSVMSLEAVLGNKLSGTIAATRLERALQMKAIHEFLKSQGPELSKDPEAIRLLDNTLAELARNIQESRADGTIGDVEYSYAYKMVQEFRSKVMKAHQEALDRAIKETPKLDLTLGPSYYEIDSAAFNVSAWRESTPALTLKFVPDPVIVPSQWEVSVSTLSADLKRIADEVEKIKESAPTSALQGFIDVVAHLPLKLSKMMNWANLPPEEAKECLHSLARLSEIAVNSIPQVGQTNASYRSMLTPEYHAAILKTVTIGYQLLTAIDPIFAPHASDGSGRLKFYPTNAIVDISAAEDEQYLHFYDPEQDDKMMQLSRYWNEQEDVGDYYSVKLARELYKRHFPGLLESSGGEDAFEDIYREYYKLKSGDEIPEDLHKWVLAQAEKSGKLSIVAYSIDKFEALSNGEKAYSLMSDSHDDIGVTVLPQFFLDYKRILQRSSPYLRFTFYTTPLELQFQDSWKVSHFETKKKWYASGRPSAIQTKSFPFSRDLFTDSLLRDLFEGGKNVRSHMLGAVDPEAKAREKLFMTSTLLDRRSQDESVMDAKTSISWQRDRELYRMFNEKDVQIVETLAFFRRHSDLLQEKDYQLLFKNLMFTPGHLLTELMHGPFEDTQRMVEELGVFLSDQYRFCVATDHFATATFLLEMNGLLVKYIDYARSQGRDFSLRNYLNASEEINEMKSNQKLNTFEHSLVHQLRALEYLGRKHLTDDELKDGMVSAFHSQIFYPPAEQLFEDRYLMISNFVHQQQPLLQKIHAEQHYNTILNAIVTDIFPGEVDRQWKPAPDFPLYESMDGEFRIDLTHVKMQRKGRDPAPLPKAIKDHPDIKRYLARFLIFAKK